jgi:hypothetical protein
MKRSPTCPCLLRLKITIRHQLLCLCSLSHVFSFDTATSQQMNQSDRVQTANRGTEDECTHKITGPCYIIKQPTIQHSWTRPLLKCTKCWKQGISENRGSCSQVQWNTSPTIILYMKKLLTMQEFIFNFGIKIHSQYTQPGFMTTPMAGLGQHNDKMGTRSTRKLIIYQQSSFQQANWRKCTVCRTMNQIE